MTLFENVKSNGHHENGTSGSRPVKVEDLPSSWDESRFGELVVSSRYGTSQASSEEGIPMLGMGNIGDLGLDLSDLSYVDPEEIDLEKYRLEKGDLLFNRTNSPELVGKTALFDLDFECVCASYLVQFKLDTDQINPKYAHYFFQTAAAQRQLRALTTRGVSQANINPSHLERDLRVVHPPLEKQNQIIETIDSWDRAIERVDALIEEKQERLHGLRQRLITGEERFPQFDEPWKSVKIGDVFSERDETGYGQLDLLAVTMEDGVIPRDQLDRRDTSSSDKSNYQRAVPGDLVYNSMRMWQGVSGVAPEEGIVSPAYTVCKSEDDIDMGYIRHLFQHESIINLFRRYSQGLTSDTLKLRYEHFAQIEIEIPPLDEQRRVAEVLDTAEAEIEKLKQKRDALKRQKKGLIQRLLTGAIRTV
jgi:type I restriction enzyme S subunit